MAVDDLELLAEEILITIESARGVLETIEERKESANKE